MLIVICAGLAFLAVLAVVVAVLDAMQAPRRRLLAAERRERWEAQQDQRQVIAAAGTNGNERN